MEKSIIEEIYMNNESISEQIVMSEKHKKLSDEAYKLYNQFIETLNDGQKKIFENFLELEMEVCAEGEFTNFKEGLKVGVLLCMECMI